MTDPASRIAAAGQASVAVGEDNHGSITTNSADVITSGQTQQLQVNFYPPVASPEPAPAAGGPRLVSNLAAPNAGFVGRDAALVELHRLLGQRGRVVTRPRARMGGVGKTQLAVEYGHRHADEYDVIWLIPAEQSELIGGQLAQAAVAAGLVDPDATISAAVQAVHRSVHSERRWLLIFDNAETPKDLGPWLPPRGGHVIITSRNLGWDETAAPVDVGLFERSESVTLLRQRITGLPATDADRLADALGDLPLAVAQAAMFMAGSAMPTDEFLRLLATHTSQILDGEHPAGYTTSLAASITVAADRLARHSPAAAQLLRLCAVLGPEPIPLTLFTRATTLPSPLQDVVADWSRFYPLVKSLGDNGLADASREGIQVHRLIQAIIRDRADPTERAASVAQVSALLVEAVPSDTDAPAVWPTWARLAPHLIAAGPADTDDPDLRTAGANLILYLLRRGETSSALQLAEQLRTVWQERLGPDDVHTLKAATEYAHARHVLGDIHGAHPIIQDTLQRRRRVFGDDHPDTLRSAHDLGVSLFSIGEHEQARDLERDVVQRRRRILGEDHPDALRSAHSLAATLNSLGEHEQAHNLALDTLERRRRVLGDDHPDTLHSMLGVAASLSNLGTGHTHACNLAQDALDRRLRILGEDHLETLDAAHSLAIILHNAGRQVPARRLIETVLQRMHRMLGADHPSTRHAQRDRDLFAIAMGGRSTQQRPVKKKKKKK